MGTTNKYISVELEAKYEDAVKSFQPYNETKEVNQEARKAIA